MEAMEASATALCAPHDPWLEICSRDMSRSVFSIYDSDGDDHFNALESEIFCLLPNTDEEQTNLQATEEEEAVKQEDRCLSAFRVWNRADEDPDAGSAVRGGPFSKKRMLHWILNQQRQQESITKRIKTEQQQDQQQQQQQQEEDLQIEDKNQLQQQQDLQSPAEDKNHLQRAPASYNHMLAERTRRSKEAEHLATLRRFIPHGSTKKATKLSVLEATIGYIKQLKCQVAQLQEQSSSKDHPSSSGGGGGGAEQEVESLTNPASMVIDDDDSSAAIHLSFEITHNPPDLVRLLACLNHFGLAAESINWQPEQSPFLSLTVHQTGSTTTDSPMSRQALHTALAATLNPTH